MPTQTEMRRELFNTYETASVLSMFVEARIFDLYGESWRITFDKNLRYHMVDKTSTVVADHGIFENWEVAEKFLLAEFPLLDEQVEVLP